LLVGFCLLALVHRRIQKIHLTMHYLFGFVQTDLIGLFASMH